MLFSHNRACPAYAGWLPRRKKQLCWFYSNFGRVNAPPLAKDCGTDLSLPSRSAPWARLVRSMVTSNWIKVPLTLCSECLQ